MVGFSLGEVQVQVYESTVDEFYFVDARSKAGESCQDWWRRNLRADRLLGRSVFVFVLCLWTMLSSFDLGRHRLVNAALGKLYLMGWLECEDGKAVMETVL